MTNAGCFQATPSSPLPPAGTCIPTNLISQQAINLLNYIPMPNIPVTNVAGQNFNYHLQTNLPGLSNRLNVNVTHQISSKLSLQVNYNLSDATSHSLNSFPGIEGNTFTRGQSVMIGLTQNWTKTFMHTSQLYFSRNRSLGLNEFSNVTDISSQLGLTGISPNPLDFGLPSISFTNFTGLSDPNFSLARSQTYRYVDSLRWMKAKHTITAGGEVRKMDINRDSDPAPNGQFSFTGLMTSQLTATGAPVSSPANCQTAAPSGPCIGNDFADFLLGYPANTKVQYGDTATYFRNWGFVGYATDDWHMFPKFTLTYGVRYEAFTPPTEINGHIANLAVSPDFTQVQCVTPVATGNCVAGPTPSLFHGHYNNWAPRVGIAWQPPGKWFSGQHQMTFRAGFSMFYVESYLNTLASEMANQPPFATASTLTQQTATTVPLSFQTNLSTAVPGTVTNTVAVNPNYQVPYAMIWNAGDRIQFGAKHVPRSDVHRHARRPSRRTSGIQFGDQRNNKCGGVHVRYDRRILQLQCVASAFAKAHDARPHVHGALHLLEVSRRCQHDRRRRPNGHSRQRRSARRLRTLVLQHDASIPRQCSAISLPFGDRQRFATKGWEKAVFGAWRVNGSFTAHSGTPYTVRVFSKNQACQNVPGTNSERADQSGNPSLVKSDGAGVVQHGCVQHSHRVLRRCAAKFGDWPRRVHDQFGT